MSSIQSALNEAQWEAVTYCDGPSLVIAGAGSGKTRVLTYKIAYLIEQGMAPWNILALTFTNKASREMKSRISQVVGTEAAQWIWAGTFHSIFSRILRQEAAFINFTHNFTIYDAGDSRSLIKTIIKEMGLDDKVYKPQTVAGRISEAKNALILPDAYQADGSIAKRDQVDGIGQTGKIYATYWQRCHAANAMDFDDLLLNTFILFRDHEEVRRKYCERFQYILVDEYQDTNAAQHRIVSQLTTPKSRICVVGDDAQSIYAFRGARIDNILGFQEQYPTTRLIKLERNYRSTQTIVDAANSLIKHNREQIPKKIYSTSEKGEPIKIFSAYSDKEESLKVAGEIRRLLRAEKIGYNDIALLYRTNAQSRSFEDTFRSYNIPYRIYGGLSFYQRKEIKDIIAYFRLISNPDDEEAFKRIINYPARGIGATTVGKLQIAATENAVSLWTVISQPQKYNLGINKGTMSKLESFRLLIDDFHNRLMQTDGSLLAADIIRQAGITADILADRSPEGLSRKENVEELLGAIQSNENDLKEENGRPIVPLTEYLSQVALLTDADQREDDQPRITLMTVHAAKGLEFDAVFVTGMEADLFPNSSARFYPREMEEERRLLYVAITRAKRFCYLTYAKSRYRYGSMEFCEPSQFLDEIDKCYVQTEDTAFSSNPPRGKIFSPHSSTDSSFTEKSKFKASSSNSWQSHKTPERVAPPTPPSDRFKSVTRRPAASTQPTSSNTGMGLAVGDIVEHARFGIGTVVSLEGRGDSAKAGVEFRSAGRKNLLLKFANIKKL